MIENLIYDVGMNNGDDTAFYLHRGYRVVAIEANPTLVADGTQRFRREIDTGQLTILDVGIAAQEGELPFWVCDSQSEWSSFNRSIASRNGSPHHEIRVQTRTFGSILRAFGTPYYLKIDIEGNDNVCLADLDPRDLPTFISVEGGDPSMLTPLRDVGFTKFKCISQFNFLPLQCPPTLGQRHYELMLWLERAERSLHVSYVGA